MTKLILSFLLIIPVLANAAKINDAYKALEIFDYFKARKLFYESYNKKTSHASYGLAIIYFRTDNPFSNIDSAAKYIYLSHKYIKDSATFNQFHINSNTINDLLQQISLKGYNNFVSNKDVKSINHFLKEFYFSDKKLIEQAFYERDKQLLEYYSFYEISDSLRLFMNKYPETVFYNEAMQRYYKYQFNEQTRESNIVNYQQFIKRFPNNPYAKTAEEKLFELIKQQHNLQKTHDFIINYSTTVTKNEAWKLLYGLSVKSYTKDELQLFIKRYPDYPFINELYKELSLTEKLLIPLKNNTENYGYIDTTGKWIIAPQYDDVSEFNEGVAVACKNDSCYYINKDGQKIIKKAFEEAENFYKGTAIVKQDSLYYLLNKAGQIISKGYQLINSPSQDVYVCKQHNLYGAINAKGNIIIPFSYQKLGDFKNGFAYYQSNKYGLININNKTTPAIWDWISDVDSNYISVIKKDTKFGLINTKGDVQLPTNYDFISQIKASIYLVVKNGLYGFYDVKNACYISNIEYVYKNSIPTTDYYNGILFKLFKENDVALQDENGKLVLNFGSYSNVYFTDSKLMRVQKNNKYGYADKKLKLITLLEFDKAENFIEQTAIVTKNNTTQLINELGKPIYLAKNINIERLNNTYFIVKQDELVGLINNKGEPILAIEYESVTLIQNHFVLLKKDDLLYLYNLNSKLISKL